MKIKQLKKCVSAVSAEILLIVGAFFVVIATAQISITAMLYVLGMILISFGFLIAKLRR